MFFIIYIYEFLLILIFDKKIKIETELTIINGEFLSKNIGDVIPESSDITFKLTE